MYTSHADCFIHLYVHNHYGMDIPFIFGNKEDSVNLSFFVKLLKKTGYIHSRRSAKQSLQSKYVNSAMLHEVIKDNKLTMIFQNKERLRTGKFYRRTSADLSIEWIVDAYQNMPSVAQNIVIVPVQVSYDRIFEQINFTNHMVPPTQKSQNLNETFAKTMTFRKDQLGEVFVQYLEPIHLKDFFKQSASQQKEQISFELTEQLYLRQQKASPVTLNSLIAAVLLYERQKSIKMSDLLYISDQIYQYVKKKQNSTTLMQVKPQQILVEKHIEGLNFKMENKGKKNCEVLLDNMKDSRNLLSLAHYSLRLSSVFVFESGYAFVLVNHF